MRLSRTIKIACLFLCILFLSQECAPDEYIDGRRIISGYKAKIDKYLKVGDDSVATFDKDGDLFIEDDAHIGSDLSISGNATLEGNLTIGGTTTISSDLTVDGSVWVDPNDATFFVDSYSNKVGIGTTSPSHKLNVSSGGIAYFQSQVHLGAQTTVYASQILKLNDEAELGFGSGQDFTIGYSDGEDYLQFVNGDTLGTNVRMVIDATGNVGIGTTAPAQKLDVAGAVTISSDLTVAGAGYFGLPVTGKDPVNDDHLVTLSYLNLALQSREITEYFSNADLVPDVGAYKSMDTALASADTVVSPDIDGLVGSPTTLFTFLTPAGSPHLDRILEGVYSAHSHLLKTLTGNLVTKIYYEVWRINAAGVDIALLEKSDLLDSSTLSAVNAPYNIHTHIGSETAIDTTDRVAVKWYGYEFSGAGTMTITLTVGDDSDSHFSLLVQPSELTSVFVPYTGAEKDVDLGAYSLTVGGTTSLTSDLTVGGSTFFSGLGYNWPVSKGGLGTQLTLDGNGNVYWESAGGIGGAGDVVGPAGATDHAVARFDTGTGKLLQDTSGVTIDDSDNITIGGTASISSDLTITGSTSDLSISSGGKVHIDDDKDTYTYYDSGNDWMRFYLNGTEYMRFE